ncbi:uncharacterized protein LOC110862948 [Folsomia candida]|nr:uncharacterized protein LOC110862948 [Folsomia candida]OXA36589.1 hypothetical protein Fcan01_28647 [Folsomia candida]
MWDFINDVDISDILDERPGRRFMDLEPDGSSYPRIPHHETDMHNLLGFSAPRENRPLGSPDFPILQIRENRERRHREQQQQGQHNLAENGHTSTSSTSMERPSCIHSSNTNTNNGSVQIRIYPTAVDLSPFGLNLSNNRSRSPAGAARPRTPGRPPSPMMPDDGECEFLGVHPIVKKPPLAVITLSSEDENEDGNHNQTSLQTDNVIDVDPIPGTSTNLMPLSALPFKRRYVAPPPELDAFQAALSALPTANLVERHMDSIPPFRQRHSSKHKKKERYRNPAFELHSSPPHKSKKQSSEIESLESTGWSRAAASAKKRKQSVTASKSSLTGKKKTVNTRSTKVKPWLLVEPSASSSPSMNSGTELKLDSSADSDSDFDVFASRIKSKKQKSPKKKTKKSKKSSKCKSKKGSKRSSSRTMSSSMLKPEKHATSSTFTNNPALSGSSSNRLKSVVMKVNKGKKSSKIKLTPSLIFTSSESSSSDEKTCRSVMFDGGMVASSSGSLTTASSSSATTIVGGTSGSSQSQEIQTPSSALDLSSTGTNSNHLSPFLGPISTSIMKRRILSRRWESDDDDNDEQEDKILISENNDEASDSGSVGRFNEHQDDPDNSDDSDFSIAHHGSRNHKRLRIDGDDDDF